MPEEIKDKKKRGWVKNAIIIFLAVMLVLTFFSNTIMNRSLPEVAVQMVDQNTINTQIRGTGTITAVQTYEVILQDTRTVQTVNITAGQQVTTGDLLFTLAAGEGSALDEAQNTLDQMRLDYQKALINATNADYASQNREIQRLREDLEEAQAERDAIYASSQAYDEDLTAMRDYQNRLDTYNALVTAAQAEVDRAQENLNSVSQGTGDYSAVTEAQNTLNQRQRELTAAQNTLASERLRYGGIYDNIVAAAITWIGSDYDMEHAGDEGYVKWEDMTEEARQKVIDEKLPVYLPAQAATYDDESNEKKAYDAITAAQDAVNDAQALRDSAQAAYNAAYNNYVNSNNGNALYNTYRKALQDAQTKLEEAQRNVTNTQATIDAIKTRTDSYKTADDNVETLEDSLEDKLLALEQQQKTDSKTQQLEQLDLQAQRDKIAEQEALVASLGGGDTSGNEVLAPVTGIVQSVSITAGNTTTPGTAIAVIEVPDLGYQVEFTVTAEQARQVSVGDSAQISNNYWWGSTDISAELVNIKTDPKAPQQNKILVFSIRGEDVTAGTQISLSIGARSSTYETVVPNSAVRSDANGNFVYLLVAKPSPLGNRYVAQRVDVQVAATDDVNSAVTGGIVAGDYVIATSTAPIETGMYVRMAEG